MSSMLKTKTGIIDASFNEPLFKLDIRQENTLIHFEPSFSGSVYLILGSFLMETADSVAEAITISKRYQKAARLCNKPVELILTDSSFQTSGQPIGVWQLLGIK
tara:strand:+ start:1653 stop:1964 length:312 start_codon:yes stop_codon:yes gene_type:complete